MIEWSEGFESVEYGHSNINLVVFFGCYETLKTEEKITYLNGIQRLKEWIVLSVME